MHRGEGPRRPLSAGATPAGAPACADGLPLDEAGLRRVMESLPPSHEVLDFYKAKVRALESEEARWAKRLTAARGMAVRCAQLEGAVDAKDAECRALRKALVEMQGALNTERSRAVRLQADNDRAKIHRMEAARKVDILLRATGKPEAELDRMIGAVDAGETFDGSSVLSDQLRRHIEATRGREPSSAARGVRSAQALRLEVSALESQLLEQERCHLEQVSTLENERRAMHREREAMFDTYEQKAGELAKYIKGLDKGQTELTRDLEEIRIKFRRCEREWLAEKETLYRKLQLVQQFGKGAPSSNGKDVNAGFFTDQRSATRLAGDVRLHKKLQKANSEAAEYKAAADSYRGQLLALEAEVDQIRDQNSASKEALKKRTRAMAEQIETLRERNEALERRKRTEAQGYQSDVKLLNQKIKQVEAQLVKAAVSKSKEHDYIRAIKAYDRELEKVKKQVKKNRDWIDP